MIEWIVTSCALIVIVLLLRLCLKNHISLRLRYALWLIVLVRLLVPVNFFSSPMSVMNAVPEAAPVAEVQQPQITNTPEYEASQPVTDTPVSQVPILPVNPMPITPENPESQEPMELPQQQEVVEEQISDNTISVVLLLRILWVTGMVITLGVFLFANIRFALRLKRTRQAEHTDCPLRVYRTAIIDTPCLFGLFRPAIYLTDEAGEDEGRQHILTHELTHYKHWDHIWGLLRCLCLVLHWYNPFVWFAAILSRRDSELACDEAVIKHLGEENRAEYGKTLIRMTCTKQAVGSIFTTATTMTGSKRTLSQRIKLIAKHPKTAIYAVICLVLVAAIAVGCTFTGAKTEKEADVPVESTTDETEVNSEETTLPKEEIAVVTDKRPEEMITKSYKLKDLRAFMDDEEMFYSDYAYDQSPRIRKLCLSDVHDKFPIECIKGKYIVYSVEEGGYFYVLMDILEAYEVGEQIVLSDTNARDTMYVSGVCDLSDFASIEVGKSTYQNVKDIDPNIEGYYSSVDDYDILRSRSPLSDGRLLNIRYERNERTNTEIVADIQINPINDDPSPYWWSRIQYEDWPIDSVDKLQMEQKSEDEILELLRKQMDVPHSYVIEEAYIDYLYYEFKQSTTQEMAQDGSWHYKVERSYEYPLQNFSDKSVVEFYYVYEGEKLVCYLNDENGKISSQVIEGALLEQMEEDRKIIDSGYAMYPQYLTDFQSMGTDEETGLDCYTFNLPVDDILKETSLASGLIELSMESYKTKYKDICDLNVQCTILVDPETMCTMSYKMEFEELKPYVLSDGAISAEYALPFLELFYIKYTFDYNLTETTILPEEYK